MPDAQRGRDDGIDGRDRERRRDKTEARQPFVENLTKVETEIASLENEIENFIAQTGMLSLTLNTTAVQSDLEDRELERNEVLSESSGPSDSWASSTPS